MREKLDHIETRLQAIIEDSLSLLFPGGASRRSLARQLVDSMETNLLTAPNGHLLAPDVYALHIHPTRLPFWQENQAVLNELARVLYQAGREAGFEFSGPPLLQLNLDDTLAAQEVRVSSTSSRTAAGQTTHLQLRPLPPNPAPPALPSGAFLIVDGGRHFALTLPVINIGRRPENHLVIDDPRVSRAHAQIRAIKGRFILFDLNSTGGTYVNSQPVTQHPLSPGDVISLAGVPLIFSHDFPESTSGDTSAMPNAPRPGDPANPPPGVSARELKPPKG